MKQLKKRTAIKALAWVALLLATGMAWAAQVAGTVTHLSGPLMARKTDGTAKILSLKSEVEQGDTLVTQKNTYAQIKMIDNSEITLRPDTTFKIEQFAFDAGKPEEDNAAFNLVKGGLRSVTGLLGKRNKEKFALKTPSATIGIRGTTFIVQYVAPDEGSGEGSDEAAPATAALQSYWQASTAALGSLAVAGVAPLQLAQNMPPAAPKAPGLAPGLYVSVIDGAINLSNKGGTQNFSAGQFGYTASFNKPPVVVPTNPGIKFTPPPAFSTSAKPNAGSSGKSTNVDCEVR